MAKEDIPRLRAEVLATDTLTHRPWFLEDGNGLQFLNHSITPEQVLFSIIKARAIRAKADSYRGFHVGACGIINDTKGMARTLAHGANYKDARGNSEIDIHAEDFIVGKVKEGELLKALAVVAPTQPDSASDIKHPTLHPCFKCRDKIQALGEAAANTLIVCALPDLTAVQWGSIDDFIAANKDPDYELGTALFNETPKLFYPTDLKPGEAIHLSDDLDIDTSEWDRKFTMPVLDWLLARAA